MEAMKRKGLVSDADSIRADIRAAMLCCGFSESNSQTSWFKVTDDPAEVVDDLKWMLHPGTSTLAEEYVKGTSNSLREVLKWEPMKRGSETTTMNAMPFLLFVADLPKEVAEVKGDPARFFVHEASTIDSRGTLGTPGTRRALGAACKWDGDVR